jgi:DNA polymerase-1
MWEYACMDALSTLELYFYLEPLMEDEGLMDIWEYKQRLIRVLNVMERRGVRVDVELSKEQAEIGRARMAEIAAEIGLNPGSPSQLKTLLIDQLGLPILKASEKTGAPSFDKSVMPIYERMLTELDNPVATLIMEYRGWQKAVTASYEPYVNLVSPDGRLRCNYNLDTTVTGRFSCSNPNLQQVPKDGDKPWNKYTKKCFIPQDGYVLINADYSQLELRLGTLYAQEAKLKQIFAEGRDIFTEMATQLGMSRQDTKTLTYTLQYGGGEKRVMDVFGVNRERARQIRNNYFNTYPRFKVFNDMCRERAEDQGRVKIWTGRHRHFMFKSDGYKAMNSVIQGGAADVVERIMLKLFDVLDDEDECRMLLQVHDAIVFEVKEELVEEYLPLIKEVMGNVAEACELDDFNDVVFAVDAGPDYGSKGWELAA